MEWAGKLWSVWRHGAVLAIINAIGLGLGLLYIGIPAWVVNMLLGLVGSGMDEDALFRLVVMLFPIWVPLGLGMAARYASTDKFKPQGYPEHI